jgi:DNA-binding response OmpR family regulator
VLALSARARPDLVLVALRLVAPDAFSGLRRLRTTPELRLMLLTIQDGEELRAMAGKGMADSSICKARLDLEIRGEVIRLFRRVLRATGDSCRIILVAFY